MSDKEMTSTLCRKNISFYLEQVIEYDEVINLNTIDVLYIKNMVVKQTNVLLKDVKNSDELNRKLCNYVIGLGRKFDMKEQG